MPDNRPKLLIVEDDPGLQRQLRWAYDGYQLFVAGDREEALDILLAEQPPVVTLDLGLPPDPDGVSEGMAALRAILKACPETKIVVASGHGDRASARQAIAEGAWDFYQKPVDIDSLGHIVGRAFHVHALEQENRRLAEAAPEDKRVLGRLITAAPAQLRISLPATRADSTRGVSRIEWAIKALTQPVITPARPASIASMPRLATAGASIRVSRWYQVARWPDTSRKRVAVTPGETTVQCTPLPRSSSSSAWENAST